VAVTVALEHRTSYRFDRASVLGPHLIRLRPAPHCRTPIESYSLAVEPRPNFLNWQQDPFGNHVARVVFPEMVTGLDVTVNLVADLTVINPLDFFVEDYAEKYPFDYPPGLANDLAPYRRSIAEPTAPAGSGVGPLLRGWLRRSGLAEQAGVPTVGFLSELNAQVAATVAYSVRMEHGVQSPDATLQRGIGSCRDSAWLLVSLARELGWAARFVSGYLVQLAPDIVDEANPLLEDFTDLHAWAEIYVPGAGWVGLDPTSGLFAGEGHIPLSATPQPAEAAPISGLMTRAGTTMNFANTVSRLVDRPRATRPYREDQWQQIVDLGRSVDARLIEDDVRLTMGGEPTFVSASDTDAAEWSIAADGTDKRAKAIELAERLKQHYAPTGVMHHGQGKWYPGEPLPRWQMAISWRTDGEPLWAAAERLDTPWGPARHNPVEGTALAGRLARLIAANLGVTDDFVLPAYEDRLQALVAEAQLPAGDPPAVDVETPGSADERAALVAELDADDGSPVGWVLPLHRTEDGEHWATAHWRTRRGRITVIGGSSPLGMRLPLLAIAWSPGEARPDPSPFAPERADALVGGGGATAIPPAVVVDPEGAPPTALTVESRDGHLFVFLPPLAEFADGQALLTAIERAATALDVSVVLEGYPLPSGRRLTSLTVTPDPGVIEVNVQPAATWDELVDITDTLDAAARASGLATEKFTVDGTHSGTGGGSHLTLGGRTPADSPLLRRPSLLVSLLTFWQNHPSLSYLFSGRFIGPTSQAPRVDEARHESLYELEIAFAELDRIGDAARPWTIDRALRHLLTDITGNTHRAEFCIDKLYSPDSDRGRLGLLELRGFEMPPHPRMSIVQALLVRALVARFWREPYRAPLVRWGTQLHDRFLLPAFVRADIEDVVADLARHGIDFEAAWLEPFLDFRFPRLGAATIGGVELEVRAAIEPWHVLGEEATGSGTARYVDSSVERVQIALSGATPGRHRLTVNGVDVALHDVGGRELAGVRFRAWAPPSALHPTIGIHAPLTFTLFDEWSNVALGSVTYHVTHPGGRAYDTAPVNAAEAEARRAARFEVGGGVDRADRAEVIDRAGSASAGGVRAAGAAGPAPETVYTLDLRRMRPGFGAVAGAARE
jgi:uncharacterized protein (DUF2126 family)/transglutaminase-like putative cysteine protease